MKTSLFFTTLLQWSAERQKSCRRYIWLVPLAVLAFDGLWAIWQLNNASARELQSGYLMMFFNLQTINTILLPLMTAVLASRLCDMEIKGGTLKLLYTLQQRTIFYDCKYMAGLRYLLFFVLGQGALLLTLGAAYHFGTPVQLPMLLEYLTAVFVVSAVLLSIQQLLSLFSDNQILPLTVGLGGSFLGLFSLFFPKWAARLILWGYYVQFSTVNMEWDKSTRITTYYEVPFSWGFFFLFIVFGMIVYMICRMLITRKEV